MSRPLDLLPGDPAMPLDSLHIRVALHLRHRLPPAAQLRVITAAREHGLLNDLEAQRLRRKARDDA